LPHLTKTVQKNWDDFDFDLSDEQQDKLRQVRQNTMRKIREIKPKIRVLVEKIELLTEKDEKIEKIIPLVKEVASLKVLATEIQLICLSKTKEILTKKQLEFLSKK
jgi:Spy/CpxP family protein refolding chaperone